MVSSNGRVASLIAGDARGFDGGYSAEPTDATDGLVSAVHATGAAGGVDDEDGVGCGDDLKVH
jgi:hypothetical protein